MNQKITPFLWFDKNAEEAANYYVSVFPNSKVTDVMHASDDNPSVSKGEVIVVGFTLDGQEFSAINGGPNFKFSEAVSFVVKCKNQEEIDYYWEKLSAHPENEQCGWCKDKFGLSWQITPENIGDLIKSEAGWKAMMDMKKIVIADLENAK